MAGTDESIAWIEGIPVSRRSFAATLELLDGWLGTPGNRRVATANLDFLALATAQPALHAALRTSDLVTADGMAVVWLSRLTARPVRERVTGADLLPALLALAERRAVKVYFLGGPPAVAERAAVRTRELHPRLRIVGVSAPQIDLADDAGCRQAAAAVRATGAELLFVGFGCPKQELFLERWGAECGARVAVGIGGAFSFLAGEMRRASPLLRGLGLEWLFRLCQEPRRLAGRYARDLLYLARAAPRIAFRRASHLPPETPDAG